MENFRTAIISITAVIALLCFDFLLIAHSFKGDCFAITLLVSEFVLVLVLFNEFRFSRWRGILIISVLLWIISAAVWFINCLVD